MKIKRPASIASATYPAQCVNVEETQRDVLKKQSDGSFVKTGEMEDVFRFSYSIAIEDEDHTLTRDCTPTLSAKGNLLKDLNALYASGVPAEVIKDDELLNAYIHDAIGKTVMLVVEQNAKGYSKVKSVVAMPKTKGAKATVKESGDVAFKYEDGSEDDIPE